MTAPWPCMVTVDVESEWASGATRAVETQLPNLLDRFRARGIPATLFCTAEVVRACPDLLAAVGPEHELASHGATHRTFDGLSPAEIRAELRDSRAAVETLGRGCAGFRSPNFVMTPAILAEVAAAGYAYDSSWASFALHAGYRNLWKSKRPVRLANPPIVEIPIPDATPARIPCGLSYYRGLDPASRLFHLGRPHLIYLHCDEFLEAGPRAGIPAALAPLFNRNRGARAWALLDRWLDALAGRGARFVTCGGFIASGAV